jgi:hypothetical protein
MPPEPCDAAESDAPVVDAQPACPDGPCPGAAVVELALKTGRADDPAAQSYGTSSRVEEHE